MGDRGRTYLKLEPGSAREGGRSSAAWRVLSLAAWLMLISRTGRSIGRSGGGAREYIATRTALAREGEGESSCHAREGEETPMRSRVRARKDRHADGKNAKRIKMPSEFAKLLQSKIFCFAKFLRMPTSIAKMLEMLLDPKTYLQESRFSTEGTQPTLPAGNW